MIPVVEPVDAAAIAAAQAELDAKTKPRGSLGRLEALAAQLAGIAGQPSRPRRCARWSSSRPTTARGSRASAPTRRR